MELLKNVYNIDFFNMFTEVISETYPSFKTDQFLTDIFDNDWNDRELKQRMRHTTKTLHNQLFKDYNKSISVLLNFIQLWNDKNIQSGKYDSLAFMFLPDYIEQYGLEHYETSINAIEIVTIFTSCEFAIRPFIKKHPKKSMAQMFKWASHKNHHVRRLASEGSRPRLPWAMALPDLKNDPAPILPILEKLKNDSSLYVRRSVANNLNDIAKDNPNVVIKIAKQWKGKTEETDWVIKHASRTLLKQGNQELMKLFGFGNVDSVKIDNFKTVKEKVEIGKNLEFSFNILNTSKTSLKIRLEYGIYYLKANGSLSKKVFKISEKNYPKNSITEINKKQSFKIITTRKFYTGNHQLSIIVNGIEFNKLDFELITN